MVTTESVVSASAGASSGASWNVTFEKSTPGHASSAAGASAAMSASVIATSVVVVAGAETSWWLEPVPTPRAIAVAADEETARTTVSASATKREPLCSSPL